MTPAVVKIRLRALGLGRYADDEKLVEWIVEALHEAFKLGKGYTRRHLRLVRTPERGE